MTARQEGRQAVVSVSDTGTGLAPEMLKSIFEMFVQVSGTAETAQGGLGIGLTLVKSLVELHGGSVEAASEGLGRGATFTVRLPLAKSATASGRRTRMSQDGWEPSIEGTILVVDDNRDAADSLAELLASMGATALVAYGGEEALQLAREHDIDIAVLDIGMPGMDGCELARHLRARPRRRGLEADRADGLGPAGLPRAHRGGGLRPPPAQAAEPGRVHGGAVGDQINRSPRPPCAPAATISPQVASSSQMPSRSRAARALRSGSPAICTPSKPCARRALAQPVDEGPRLLLEAGLRAQLAPGRSAIASMPLSTVRAVSAGRCQVPPPVSAPPSSSQATAMP